MVDNWDNFCCLCQCTYKDFLGHLESHNKTEQQFIINFLKKLLSLPEEKRAEENERFVVSQFYIERAIDNKLEEHIKKMEKK